MRLNEDELKGMKIFVFVGIANSSETILGWVKCDKNENFLPHNICQCYGFGVSSGLRFFEWTAHLTLAFCVIADGFL